MNDSYHFFTSDDSLSSHVSDEPVAGDVDVEHQIAARVQTEDVATGEASRLELLLALEDSQEQVDSSTEDLESEIPVPPRNGTLHHCLKRSYTCHSSMLIHRINDSSYSYSRADQMSRVD